MIKTRMSQDEMMQFIKNVGRSELFEEMEDAKELAHVYTTWNGKSRYLKAVRASLIALGYDREWVDTDFKEAIEDYYYGEQAKIDNKAKLEMADSAASVLAALFS